MDFEKNVPEWHAEGTEPPASLKQSGFEAGYKPPAAYFNWFWNRVSACLTEIRNKLKGHVESTSNPHGVTASQIGLDKVDNTSDAEKSVKRASTSGTADKTKSSMTVRLNGGNTEGADKWTFDGSTARSVNITPSGIGASKSDLSNVDNAVFRSKASSAGATGLPVVAAESTDGVAYIATVPSVTELSNGLTIVIVPNKTSTATQATLNVNSLGAKEIRIPLSFNTAAMSTPKLSTFFTEGRPITVQFDAGYVSGGIWKTIDKQRTSAQDLYGTVPVESGGTGATDAATARSNLGALTYAQYENGYFQTGASNTSAWLSYSVSGTQKCQLDLTNGGTLMVNQKTVLVKGNAVPFANYTENLTTDSWCSGQNFVQVLRNGGTQKCEIAMWDGGAFTINGNIAWHRGNVDIQVGTATVGTTGTTITFPRAFAGVPTVTANGSKQTSIRVYDITASGCTLASGESNNTVQWQAIYTG